MPTAADFRQTLKQIFVESQHKGVSFIDIRSGDLHRKVGGYPIRNHRMPVCCRVMCSLLEFEDKIISEPPSGMGATLEIRYQIPRKAT
jgi:hypothetical protein